MKPMYVYGIFPESGVLSGIALSEQQSDMRVGRYIDAKIIKYYKPIVIENCDIGVCKFDMDDGRDILHAGFENECSLARSNKMCCADCDHFTRTDYYIYPITFPECDRVDENGYVVS